MSRRLIVSPKNYVIKKSAGQLGEYLLKSALYQKVSLFTKAKKTSENLKTPKKG